MHRHGVSNVRTPLQPFGPEAVTLGIGSENGKEGSRARGTEEKLASRFPTWGAAVIPERTNSTWGRGEQMRGSDAGYVLA